MTFEAEDGGQVSKATLDVLPETPINRETATQSSQTIYFGDVPLDTNKVVATALTGHDFAK